MRVARHRPLVSVRPVADGQLARRGHALGPAPTGALRAGTPGGQTARRYQPAGHVVVLQNSEAPSLVIDRLPSIIGYRITVKPLIDQPSSIVSRLNTNVSSASA